MDSTTIITTTTTAIKCKITWINHCIPSIARYFGVTRSKHVILLEHDVLEEEEDNQQDTLKKRKRDHQFNNNNNNNNHDTNKMILDNNDNLPLPLLVPHPLTTFNNTIEHQQSSNTLSIRFKSLIGSPFIKHCIFNHIKEMTKIDKETKQCKSSKGEDILKLVHFGMVSQYAMPWNFIKHYLPDKDNVLLKRRMYIISKYCTHPNATLDTLLHLLEWSPEYDPQDQYENCHQRLIYDVAIQGNRDILEFLLKRYPNTIINPHGYKLESIIDTAKGTTKALDIAAEKGYLDIFLHFNRTEGCTIKAMDNAAFAGNIDIVKFLHYNRSEGCTTNAMDYSLLNDDVSDFEVLKFLHYNRTEGCKTDAMDNAAVKRKFEALKFLHYNRTEGCSLMAMNWVASQGDLEMLKVCDKREIINQPFFFFVFMSIVEFLHKHRTEGCSEIPIQVQNSGLFNYECCKYLVSNKIVLQNFEIDNMKMCSRDAHEFYEIVELVNQHYL
ncbi:hypothetical protein DFA_04190 [Cavenderia fasciculata]|uniref:Ankyrin repeat-containing protein n=1 Tax=Cavenderia fasciculata TaxID=261658 RepID=F4Q1J3_CACFS|nr:uncharacterized protein DFA_04190 [Cavenderia fasciculata]EGG18694.1 hypothetical protein DFA_04190 [Cavenderia fasciculata]|eukprot:XP_004366598.1 hypothetical protein DFA_04190 [Cavenderia fasciculata]